MLCQNHFNIVGRCYGNAIKKGKYTSLFISIKEKKVLTLLKVVAFGQVGEDLLLMGRDKNTLAIQGHMRTITHRDRFNNQTTQVYFMVDDVIILTKSENESLIYEDTTICLVSSLTSFEVAQ